MNNTLVNLVVIGLIAFTLFLAIYTALAAKKRKAGTQSSEKAFNDWLTAQGFVADHVSCFGATGIASRNGDKRLVVQSKGVIRSMPLEEIASIATSSSTIASRPLGAAPGVVEVNETRIYNLDIHIAGSSEAIRIRFETESRMQEWEQRLNGLIESS